MKIALCQLRVSDNKPDNISRVREMLLEAADLGAEIAVLPEMFCIAYSLRLFPDAAEPINGDCFLMLSDCAKKTGMTIIGGSIPEFDNGRIYNTCMVFGSDGTLIGTYRKAHLFDVHIADFKFIESDVISPGNTPPLIFDSPIKTGVSICFDIRFPELARYIMHSGADLFALPAAFSQKTGPRHWELLLRARALDNQMFVAGVAPASSKSSYGHSMLCSPDGQVLCDAGENESLMVCELPLDMLSEARASIPVRHAMRPNIYVTNIIQD